MEAKIPTLKCGIDPGITGALALLQGDTLLEVLDMPVMAATKKRKVVNAVELGKILSRWQSQGNMIAYLEAVHSMPKQGVSSVFSFGVSYGIFQGILGALRVPVVLITPQTWKKRAGLKGADKDMTRTKMQRLYPNADLSLKKHIGRADAIAIARWG